MVILLFGLSAVGACGDQDAELGARLTCHLLLRLFSATTTPFGTQSNASKGSFIIKSSCDRHLLAAAHDSITVGAVVAVLKAILMLGKWQAGHNLSKCTNYTLPDEYPSQYQAVTGKACTS